MHTFLALHYMTWWNGVCGSHASGIKTAIFSLTNTALKFAELEHTSKMTTLIFSEQLLS